MILDEEEAGAAKLLFDKDDIIPMSEEQKREDYKDDESADCNLTRSDRPSLMVRGLGELVN